MELAVALRGACAGFAALRLRAEGVGFFPDSRNPRVTWVGVRDGNDELPELQKAIEIAVEDFAEEKSGLARRRGPGDAFVGHVTLARIQGIRREQAEILAKLTLGMSERFFGEWSAENVELIRSELSSSGSRYTTLAAFPLSGT
jgi:2'-5' RNA ligase